MNTDDLDLDNLFTTDGKDVWRMVSFCTEPTCRLVNIENKEERHFGIGGIESARFHRIPMPVIKKKDNEFE